MSDSNTWDHLEKLVIMRKSTSFITDSLTIFLKITNKTSENKEKGQVV